MTRTRAAKIEIRAKAPGPGKHVGGVWQPAGQLITTIYVVGPARVGGAVARAITVLDGEEVVTEVVGREDIETE